MDAERFEHLAAAYGGDPGRWPQAERTAALAFLAADKVAAERILFEARQVDAALDSSPQPQASRALRDAILAAAPQAPVSAPVWTPVSAQVERKPRFDWGRWLAPAAGLVCASVVGLYGGAAVMQYVTADARADAFVAEAVAPSLDEQEILG